MTLQHVSHRQRAWDTYRYALGMAPRPPVGWCRWNDATPDDWTAERRRRFKRAQAAILAALESGDRHVFLGEPSDDDLRRMLERVRSELATI